MKNMILFCMGRLVSMLGTFMFQFAAGLYVLKITGSGMQFALTLILGVLPKVILSPLAGIVADRISRKTIVVVTDLISGGFILGIVALFMNQSITVPAIYITMVVLTICSTFFDIAIEAAKPDIVEADQLERLNAISHGIVSLTQICGPILGGVVYSLVDFKLFMMFNGISFILSGISEMFITFNKHIQAEPYSGSIRKEFSGVILYLRTNALILVLMVFSLSINFCLTFSLSVPIPYFLNNILKLSPELIGIVSAGFPVGYVIGALLISIRPVLDREKSMKYSLVGLWLSMLGLTLSVWIIPRSLAIYMGISIMVFEIILGLSIAYLDIPLITFMQKSIPSNIIGKVFSLSVMASRVAMPVAMIFAGQLLDKTDPKWLFLVGTSIAFLSIIQLLSSKHTKDYYEPELKSVVVN